MYEFNWLLTRAFWQNGTGTKGKTDRQRDKETKRQTDKERKAQAQRHVYFSRVLGVSCCLLVCFVFVCH